MSLLDGTIRILSKEARDDAFIKNLHTAALNLKVGNERTAFQFETSCDGAWGSEGVVSKKQSGKYKRKARGLRDPFLPAVRANSPGATETVSGEKGQATGFIEDISLVVGNSEHDNRWRDYTYISNTLAGAEKAPLKGGESGSKKASLAIRYSDAVPAGARKGAITGIVLASASSPPPPLLERNVLSLSRRHHGALKVVETSETGVFSGSKEKSAGGSDEKRNNWRVDTNECGNSGQGNTTEGGALSLCVYFARSGLCAPGIERIGLLAPSRECLPTYAHDIIRRLDCSNAAGVQGSGTKTIVRLCFYRSLSHFLRRSPCNDHHTFDNTKKCRNGGGGDEKNHDRTVEEAERERGGRARAGGLSNTISSSESKEWQQRRVGIHLPTLDDEDASAGSLLTLFTGMMLTSSETLILHALKFGAGVAAQAPFEHREAFASKVASEAVNLIGVLNTHGRTVAGRLAGDLAMCKAGEVSLPTRTRLTMASLLLLNPGGKVCDGNTWKVVWLQVPIRREADFDADIIDYLEQGDEVLALEQVGVWIRCPRGWVQAFLQRHQLYQPGDIAQEANDNKGNAQHNRDHHESVTRTTFASGKEELLIHPLRKQDTVESGFFSIIESICNICVKHCGSKTRNWEDTTRNSTTSSSSRTSSSSSSLSSSSLRGDPNNEVVADIVGNTTASVDTHRWNQRFLSGHDACTYAFCDAASNVVDEAFARGRRTVGDTRIDGNLKKLGNQSRTKLEIEDEKLLTAIAICLAKHTATCAEFAAGGVSKVFSTGTGGVTGSLNGSYCELWDSGERLKATCCVRALARILDAGCPIFTESTEQQAQLFRTAILPTLSPLFVMEPLPMTLTGAAADLFRVIYTNYRHIAKSEVAVVLNEGIIPRICNPDEIVGTRIVLLSLLLDILKHSDTEAMGLFYNYDIDTSTASESSPAFSLLTGVLSNIMEACIKTAMEGMDEKHASKTGGASPSRKKMSLSERLGPSPSQHSVSGVSGQAVGGPSSAAGSISSANKIRCEDGAQRLFGNKHLTAAELQAALDESPVPDAESPQLQKLALECLREISRQALRVGGLIINRDAVGDRLSLPKPPSISYREHHKKKKKLIKIAVPADEEEDVAIGSNPTLNSIITANGGRDNTSLEDFNVAPKQFQLHRSPRQRMLLEMEAAAATGMGTEVLTKQQQGKSDIHQRNGFKIKLSVVSPKGTMRLSKNGEGEEREGTLLQSRVKHVVYENNENGDVSFKTEARGVRAAAASGEVDGGNDHKQTSLTNGDDSKGATTKTTHHQSSRRTSIPIPAPSALPFSSSPDKLLTLRRTRQKIFDKALLKAKEIYSNRHSDDEHIREKAGRAVKDCVKYLFENGISDPRFIADFLFNNAHRSGRYFGKDHLAEFLGSKDDWFHTNLRLCYADRIDLRNLDFVQALRLFSGDSGFLMINLESAKVLRLLDLFSIIYRRDNPNSPVRSIDAANTLSQMLMAVHTGLWNKSARKQQAPPKAEDLASYLRDANTAPNLRDEQAYQQLLPPPPFKKLLLEQQSSSRSATPDDMKEKKGGGKGDFPFSFLMRQYRDIASTEIKNLGGSSGLDNRMAVALRSTRQLRGRLRCFKLPKLKIWWGVDKLPLRHKQSLAKIVFEEIYGQLWRAVNCIIHGSDRMDSSHMCLDILAHGLLLATMTGLDTEFQGFLELLAERTFVENEMSKQQPDAKMSSRRATKRHLKGRTLKERLLRQEHLHRQTWFKHVRTYHRDGSKELQKRTKAIKQILLEVSNCKSKVRQRKQIETLKLLQSFFGHKIFLISSKRTFIKSARLVKISAAQGQRKTYTFFLFNDLLIYAAGSLPHYKVHQTLHLSLATVKNILIDSDGVGYEDPIRHQLISPQKSFIIEYSNPQMKHEWMRKMEHLIEKQRQAHFQHAMQLKSGGCESGRASATLSAPFDPKNHTSSSEYETDPEITSSFFNVRDMASLQDYHKRSAWVCKLCIRVHSKSRWRRRTTGTTAGNGMESTGGGAPPPNGAICGVCGDIICRKCASHSLHIRGVKARVCDCCYGVIKGDIPGTTMMSTMNITTTTGYFSSRAGAEMISRPNVLASGTSFQGTYT